MGTALVLDAHHPVALRREVNPRVEPRSTVPAHDDRRTSLIHHLWPATEPVASNASGESVGDTGVGSIGFTFEITEDASETSTDSLRSPEATHPVESIPTMMSSTGNAAKPNRRRAIGQSLRPARCATSLKLWTTPPRGVVPIRVIDA